MKTTIIHLRAFNSYFTLKVKKKEYLSIAESTDYAKKHLACDTVMVAQVSHDGKIIKNINYKDPEKVFAK